MTADRHLLFGLLALQNEFIDKRQLVAAFGTWIADQSQSLDEILVQQQALKEDDRAVLSRLVDRHIAARGGDVTASLHALSSVGSVRDELERLADPNVTVSIAHLKPSSHGMAVPSMGQVTSSGQRFEIRRPLARGGLGVVSIALDKELNREIALKEIRSDRADDEEYRSKFVLEAEVTGGLEHPGIVPVYGLGTGPDGRPYYAMRLIKGDNLQEHVKRFHANVASGKEPFDGPELRKLLRRFLDVCQAIDYAHSRGVLHRDLKPGNIMLGKYGETLVVDWGLAKPLGTQHREQLTPTTESTIESPLVPSGSNDGMTIQGSMVGTAAYAPPEQLSGNLDQVNERSDVYGLGAMLYELLTGQPPAQGNTLAAVIKMVVEGAIKPPRSIQPQAPKPLEAICLRAIARRPEDRYATAAELGLEIERWLDDLPVSTYPEPLLQRTKRWIRNHQAIVATASAIILMSTIGLGLYSSIISKSNAKLDQKNLELTAANEREKLQRKEAEDQKQKAIAQRELAEGINTFFSEELFGLASPSQLQGVELKLIDALKISSNKIEQQFPEDDLLRAQLHHRVGSIFIELGEPDQAVEHLTKSVAIRKHDRDGDPVAYGRSMERLAAAYNLANRIEEADQQYMQTLEFQIARFGPDNIETLTTAQSYCHYLRENHNAVDAARITLDWMANAEKALGPEHVLTLQLRSNLSWVYRWNNDWDNATKHAENAVEGFMRTRGKQYPETGYAI
jgi:eukaryotic-like serine/threonine-protein kinase